MKQDKKANEHLRHERENRGWSQGKVAALIDVDSSMVSRWECGERKPSAFYQEKLCLLFGKSAEELGFIEPLHSMERLPQALSSSMEPQKQFSRPLMPQNGEFTSRYPAFSSEPPAGTRLAMNAVDLAALFEAGWTGDAILEALQIVLRGVQAMPKWSRRRMLQWGTTALLSGVPVLDGKHISAEERLQLHAALGESIAAGWKLFHTAGNAQVLAVAQAQLFLVQQNHSSLYLGVQPLFYSAVYRLIGAALHFQGQYEEAYQAQEKAYLSALEGADAWNMAQSRGWQAYGLKAGGNYYDAMQAADAALRIVSHQNDTESIRLRARLLTFLAENAALLNNTKEVQTNLSHSEALLEQLSGCHEEFDSVSWFQQAGVCALNLKQYKVAVERLRQALDGLSVQWTLRYVSTAVPLARALTYLKERDEALTIARKIVPTVKSLQSSALTQEFTNYLHADLLASFPNDKHCQAFVAEAKQQLALA